MDARNPFNTVKLLPALCLAAGSLLFTSCNNQPAASGTNAPKGETVVVRDTLIKEERSVEHETVVVHDKIVVQDTAKSNHGNLPHSMMGGGMTTGK